ncbi:MAG TPA: glycosyltransferase 87 family protein [Chthoniobacterales bacterium]
MEPATKHIRYLNLLAIVAWGVALLVVIARILLLPHRGTCFNAYQLSGWDWFHGEALYANRSDSFVYSPLVAALFVPLASLPPALGAAIWIIFDASIFLVGIVVILRTDLYPNLGPRNYGVVLLLLLPMALSNLDIAQANPVLAGLLLLTIAAVWAGQWNMAAVCAALAAYLKIYPLAVGLLIFAIAPRQFGWRLLLALIVFGLLPFLLQHWDYVVRQYGDWFRQRIVDNRFNNPDSLAPIDLWFLLVRMGKLPISFGVYRFFQIASGIGIALYCVVRERQGWPLSRVLIALFSLASVWMTLCGPATEGVTYLLLAPAVVFALVQAFLEPQSVSLRTLIFSAYALLFLTAAKNSLLPHLSPWTRAMQPLGAVVFLSYCFFWLSRFTSPRHRAIVLESKLRRSSAP